MSDNWSNLNSRLLKVGSFFTESNEISNQDLNNLVNAGIYMGYNMANSPNAGEWWHVIHLNHHNYYFVQIAIAFTREDVTMYKRICRNNKWESWMFFSPGTATAAQVLKGYTFSSAAGSNLTGTYDPGNDYNNGYTNGRSQGQSDVTSNPNGYGLYTQSQYDANYSNGYNAGVIAKTSKSWTGHVTITSNGSVNVGFEPHIILIKRDGDNFPIGVYCSYGISVNHMEGPSNSHLPNIFSTNGNGFSFGTLNSYTNNKYCYCAAFKIV